MWPRRFARRAAPPPLLALPSVLLRRCSSTRSHAAPLSDERIMQPASEHGRWLQLVPACLSGASIGTYLATPAVLGPHICRAQGVVAQMPTDFAFSAIPQAAVLGGATSAVASVLLAPHVARMGTRRIALAGACLFPGGMLLAALAVHANHWPLYAFSTTVVSGLGFWCVYPQMPPFLATKWFADGRRRGLALSLYFAAFGSGLFFATPFLEAARDLSASGFADSLREGVFLLDGASGAAEALAALAGRTPQLWLLAGGTLGLSMAGLPFLSVGKLMMSDLGSAAAAAAVAGGAAVGPNRRRGGLRSDALPCMPLATRALAGGADPETALTLFRAATCVNVGAYAGVPATADLFGSADAAAIYQRIGATITFASPLGAAVCTRLRDGAYAQHAAALTELCDEATFAA
uniref:Uncharacterized protein n=2 Tax=Emiliania huxleyi TaxID=2903 RepID=A0A0D3KPS5_EMIH1